MSEQGYVRVHRRLFGHAAFRNDSEALAFAWMVAKASWKPTRVRYKEHTIELDRGDLTVSIRDISAALDRPKGWVERLISRLKSETMIRTQRATRSRTAPLVISVVNYDTYQSQQDSDRTRDGTQRGLQFGTAAGQRPDREQGREEVKKKETQPNGCVRARTMPSGFEPSDGDGKMAEIAAHWTPERRATELERWRAHHRAKGTTAKDWNASWHTWIGNSQRFGGGSSNGYQPPGQRTPDHPNWGPGDPGHSGIPI